MVNGLSSGSSGTVRFSAAGTFSSCPAEKEKTLCLFCKRQSVLKTLCGTTLGCRPLTEGGRSQPAAQADGITPVTRPRLLASSFSRRLQGDFHRRACPPRTKRRLSLQTFDRLLFLFFAKYPVTRLSYHIFTVCQPYFPGFSPENTDFSVPTASRGKTGPAQGRSRCRGTGEITSRRSFRRNEPGSQRPVPGLPSPWETASHWWFRRSGRCPQPTSQRPPRKSWPHDRQNNPRIPI